MKHKILSHSNIHDFPSTMNTHDDLLEPFPVNNRRADTEISFSSLFQHRLSTSNNSFCGKSSSSNLASSRVFPSAYKFFHRLQTRIILAMTLSTPISTFRVPPSTSFPLPVSSAMGMSSNDYKRICARVACSQVLVLSKS